MPRLGDAEAARTGEAGYRDPRIFNLFSSRSRYEGVPGSRGVEGNVDRRLLGDEALPAALRAGDTIAAVRGEVTTAFASVLMVSFEGDFRGLLLLLLASIIPWKIAMAGNLLFRFVTLAGDNGISDGWLASWKEREPGLSAPILDVANVGSDSILCSLKTACRLSFTGRDSMLFSLKTAAMTASSISTLSSAV